MPDIISIEILPDGTIKTNTNNVSMPNHANAEMFMREMARLTGGTVRRVLKVGASLAHALHLHAHDGHSHQH